jgi:hypothetical protein
MTIVPLVLIFSRRNSTGTVIGAVAVNDVAPDGEVVRRSVSSQTSFVHAARVVDVVTMLCHVVPSVE